MSKMLAIRAFHAPNLIVFQHKQHGNTQKPYRFFLHLIVLPGFVIVQHNVRDSYIPQAREYCQYLICSARERHEFDEVNAASRARHHRPPGTRPHPIDGSPQPEPFPDSNLSPRRKPVCRKTRRPIPETGNQRPQVAGRVLRILTGS